MSLTGKADVPDAQRVITEIKTAIAEVIVGYDKPVELLLCALFSGGHVLMQDVPGVGKTTLAQTVAAVSGLDFERIQFTPDLLPSDVTGVNVYLPDSGEFSFQRGPVFTNILLADEINRATPRTQSALLECMQEGQVTVGGETRQLPRPFLTLATQNPVEMAGTFPLPAAQLDRFLMQLSLGYPSREDELEIVKRSPRSGQSVQLPDPVCDPRTLQKMSDLAEGTFLSEELQHYVVSLIRATRDHVQLRLGASPRAAVMLARASQALAFVRGREYVIPDDVQDLTVPVLSHRLLASEESVLRHRDAASILQQVSQEVSVPEE